MFAVISYKGKQYKVCEGKEQNVDLVDDPSQKKIVFSDVLLVSEDKKVLVGAPLLPGVSVEAEIVGDAKGDKVSILKFKAKKRYKRNLGHTQKYTRVRISKIKTNEK